MSSEHKKMHPLKQIRRFLVTTVVGGFAVVLPMALMVAIVQFLFNFVTRVISPMRGLIKFSPDVETWIIDLSSLLIIIIAFFLIGLVVRTSLGKRLFAAFDKRLLGQIPLYPTLRNTVQQFFGKKKMPFSQVVVANVLGARMTGFVTDERADRTFTIFVPTAPNPTNGFVIHADHSELEFLDVTPEEAMRTIIGMGTGSEMLFGPPEGTK